LIDGGNYLNYESELQVFAESVWNINLSCNATTILQFTAKEVYKQLKSVTKVLRMM